MVVLASTCFLFGAMLALRFTFWILVPVINFGLVFALFAGLAHNYGFGRIALSMTLISVGLQLGYLAIIGTDYLLIGSPRSRPGINPVSRPAH
jgi:hypothetical protein